ncbi:hypothetical protein QYM36_007769 [Artemia franciscana]|uniref:Uncharacterized protein n=1 Tax=Artemia franciscana TaxID=6661 RepID=A0AA88IE71_ARTSF|nr:hypothetical protein QYM36_007769 [Artemia franciscana]
MKSEIRLLILELSEKDKLISELNSRIEHQEQRLLELEVKDPKLYLAVHGLRKEKNGKTLEQNLQDLLRSSLEIKDNIQITRSFRVKQNKEMFLLVTMPRNLVYRLLSSLAARGGTFLLS